MQRVRAAVFERVEQCAATLTAAARAANQRRLLLLSGEPGWCHRAAVAALAAAGLPHVLWVTERPPEGAAALPAAKATEVLGREYDAVVFDAHCGLHLDALGAISGTVRGGGLLLLLAPPLAEWPAYPDPDYARITVSPYTPGDVAGRFLRRLVRVIEQDPDVAVVAHSGPPPAPNPAADVECRPVEPPRQPMPPATPGRAQCTQAAEGAGSEYGTADQRRAVETILAVAASQRRRPVVLTSDRGRGKSTALGIAAAHLLRQGMRHIVVTGPRPEASEKVFEHAARLLPEARASRASVQLGEARLEFVAPDVLVQDPPTARLLLVDEAAAIPTPLLEALLERHSHIVFATTVHGYEGTGRGFAVRFQKALDVRTPGWRAVRMETPVRWAAGDPLERFTFRALLLDAAAAPDSALSEARPDTVQVERVDRDALAEDEAQLSELFGLLVLAHYRTRPFDLRVLLDAPNVAVYALRHRGRVVATALSAAEGGLDADTAWRVWAGHTRPHGHLMPETLAAHLGLDAAPRLCCARVLRIAVHPAVQGRGLGSRLIEAVAEDARTMGLAYIGSSFGATPELLRFWGHCGFTAVRFSVKRSAASGVHSALVVRALTGAGGELTAAARTRFLQELPHQLSDPLRTLDPALAAPLLLGADAAPSPALSREAWRDLLAFCFGGRIYEVCMAPAWALACCALGDPAALRLLGAGERDVLIVKVLQRRDWAAVAQATGAPGRAGATRVLRAALGKLLLHYADEEVRAEARRLQALWRDPTRP
jgi:tRNA(Met) cytidine acetyltransferase